MKRKIEIQAKASAQAKSSGYDTDQLFALAIKACDDKDCVFLADVIASLPCCKNAFYKHITIDSDRMTQIKDLLNRNKTTRKKELRKNWSAPDASASLQISLYKLLADPDELARLTGYEPEKDQPIANVRMKPNKLADSDE